MFGEMCWAAEPAASYIEAKARGDKKENIFLYRS